MTLKYFFLFYHFLTTTLSCSLSPVFSKRSNSWFCKVVKPVANFVSRSSSSVTSVLPGQGQAHQRQSLCTYTMKRWSFPPRFSVNGIQHDWQDRLHVTSPSRPRNFTSTFTYFGCMREEQRPSSERNQQCTSHQNTFHLLFQRLSREKGDTNSFGSLQLLLSLSHRATGTSPLWPLDGYTIQRRDSEGLRCLQHKRVAGSNMSKWFKIPEGQRLDRSPQKRILASLQIRKWTLISDAVCCKNCQNQNATLGC